MEAATVWKVNVQFNRFCAILFLQITLCNRFITHNIITNCSPRFQSFRFLKTRFKKKSLSWVVPSSVNRYRVAQNKVYLVHTILWIIQRAKHNIDIHVHGCVTTFLRDFDKFSYLIFFLLHDILYRAVFLFTGRKRITFNCWHCKLLPKW